MIWALAVLTCPPLLSTCFALELCAFGEFAANKTIIEIRIRERFGINGEFVRRVGKNIEEREIKIRVCSHLSSGKQNQTDKIYHENHLN